MLRTLGSKAVAKAFEDRARAIVEAVNGLQGERGRVSHALAETERMQKKHEKEHERLTKLIDESVAEIAELKIAYRKETGLSLDIPSGECTEE